MDNLKIIYKGFCEDNTKAGKLRILQVESILCIFEESIAKCLKENLNDIRFKTSEFKKLKNLTKLPDFDFHLQKKDIARSIIWVGTFKTKKRRFMVFADVVQHT
jgi:hypothetical protein